MSNDIYSYIKENFGIEITDYQFKRDYIKEPLTRCILHRGNPTYEFPYKEDFIYLYITINLSRKDLEKIFKISSLIITKIINYYNIKKDKQLSLLIRDKTNLEKYGVTHPSVLEEVKKKQEQTNLERYGTKSSVQNSKVKKKQEQTNLERYGFKNPFQNKNIQKLAKQARKEKYGVEYYSQLPEWNDKIKKTNLEKYGVENYSNREKAKQTNLEKYGVENLFQISTFREKALETMKNRYGALYSLSSPILKEKIEQTCLEKYGAKSFLESNNFQLNREEYIKKAFETKKKNGSFKKSKEEDEIYNLLIQKYPDTIRQYQSDLYPFMCDFYIPEIDTYIEYQGYWKHGNEPYTGTDNQKEIVKLWEEKSKEINFKGELKESYLRAINTWTISYPLKRKTAKDNGLNWLEFFTIEEFMNWYNQNY